jgi:hypothetical protein
MPMTTIWLCIMMWTNICNWHGMSWATLFIVLYSLVWGYIGYFLWCMACYYMDNVATNDFTMITKWLQIIWYGHRQTYPPPTYIPAYLPTHQPTYLLTHPSTHPPTYLLCTCLPTHLFTYPFTHLPTLYNMPTYLPISYFLSPTICLILTS